MRKNLLTTARMLMLVWAIYWFSFGMGSGYGQSFSVTGLLYNALMPGGIFLAVTYLAWRSPKLGGVVVPFAGIAMGIVLQMNLVLSLMLTIPPIIAGGLLMVHEFILKAEAAKADADAEC